LHHHPQICVLVGWSGFHPRRRRAPLMMLASKSARWLAPASPPLSFGLGGDTSSNAHLPSCRLDPSDRGGFMRQGRLGNCRRSTCVEAQPLCFRGRWRGALAPLWTRRACRRRHRRASGSLPMEISPPHPSTPTQTHIHTQGPAAWKGDTRSGRQDRQRGGP
jgi:hypothetical protein